MASYRHLLLSFLLGFIVLCADARQLLQNATAPLAASCNRRVQFSLALDSSGSITDAQFEQLRQFAVDFSGSVANSASTIAAALFTCPSATIVTPAVSPADAAAIFKTMQRDTGGTSISAGLQQAAELLPRQDLSVSRIVILVTDGEPDCPGESRDQAIKTAKDIRDTGVFILPVGVGSGVGVDLLKQVASDPTKVYSVADYAELLTRLGTIVGGACAAAEQPCTGAKEFGYAGNMAGDVIVLDVGSMDASLRRLESAEACKQACINLKSCNGWVYCNSADGCGYTCSTWVNDTNHAVLKPPADSTTKIDYSAATPKQPVLGFGPWPFTSGGCELESWPFGVCTLKRVENPESPTFYTNEMKGWLSGTITSKC